jgi:hypothetical protein
MTKFEEMLEKNPTLKQLVEKGLLRPPSIESGEVPLGHPVAPLAQLLAELDELRADRRP